MPQAGGFFFKERNAKCIGGGFMEFLCGIFNMIRLDINNKMIGGAGWWAKMTRSLLCSLEAPTGNSGIFLIRFKLNASASPPPPADLFVLLAPPPPKIGWI